MKKVASVALPVIVDTVEDGKSARARFRTTASNTSSTVKPAALWAYNRAKPGQKVEIKMNRLAGSTLQPAKRRAGGLGSHLPRRKPQ